MIIPNLPDGWRWFKSLLSERYFFEQRAADGSIAANYVAFQYDPKDEALESSGDFTDAVKRGAAKQFTVTPRDIRLLGILNRSQLEALLED